MISRVNAMSVEFDDAHYNLRPYFSADYRLNILKHWFCGHWDSDRENKLVMIIIKYIFRHYEPI